MNMNGQQGVVPGFFGKVRSHGDFITRRLPADFTGRWDPCLQQGMVFARHWFGEHWLPVYLNAPLWCFALGAEVCGPTAWAGVLLPGVDRVGRYFPFTLAAPLPGTDLAGWLSGAQDWYDGAARLAFSTLGDGFELDRFDREVAALPLPSVSLGLTPWRPAPLDGGSLAAHLAACAQPGRSVWWTEGSAAVPATLRVVGGLPNGAQFAGLLDATCPGWQLVMALQA